jgi:MHS family proline/betaine transporter-like MFS transporter
MNLVTEGTRVDAASYRRRVIVATSIGNALEWFDFVVYGFLAVTMAKLFFPASDQVASLLLTFGTFGITFLLRPLGAILIGAYTDRRGRKPALTLTITLMMVGTAMMAIVPTYRSIGVWAALAVIAARMLQSLSAGGEYGAATAFLVEQDPTRRGFLASWQYASQSLTTILATGFGAGLSNILTLEQLEAWGWRIPFVFGLLIGPVAYYIRRQLHETPQFSAMPAPRAPIRRIIAGYKLRVVLCIGVIAVSSINVYTILFMPTFAIKQLGLPPSVAYLGGLLTGTFQLILIPVVGLLSDRYGRTLMPLAAAVAVLFLIYPMFAWMVAVPALSTLLMVQCALGILNALYLGCQAGLISELFPTRLLGSGLSIGNALAVTIFGGFAPFISVLLIEVTGSPLAPSFYLMFGAVISITALIGVRRLGL